MTGFDVTGIQYGDFTIGSCRYCGESGFTISDVIGFCAECIRDHFEQVWPEIKLVHDRSRRLFGLPTDPPRATGGKACPLCVHRCEIPESGAGFCGIRRVKTGKVIGGRPHEGNLSYSSDPLPTNCVGDFVCPAGTGCGYPRYAVSRGPEYGYKNLAVFYNACSFNCLYCQNYQFKKRHGSTKRISAVDLAKAVDDQTTCICYFGGDPTPHILHALKTSKLALNRTSDRVLRVCWETNGAMKEPFLTLMAQLSLQSGGSIKFDLKAWDPGIHHALCGVSNEQTLENFKVLSGWIPRRPDPPLLIASTLLVPGYVNEIEIEGLASYLAQLNPEIPYSLLAFDPCFYLYDLIPTSRSYALRCKEIAERAGLKRVHIDNLHLLRDIY